MTKKRRNRSILFDSNAIYYYLAREGVKAAHVAHVNGIARSSMTNKMTRDLQSMTLKSFIQIARGVNKPVGVVVEEVLGIDKQLREAYGLDEIDKNYQESRRGPQLVLDRDNPINHQQGRRVADRGAHKAITVKYN